MTHESPRFELATNEDWPAIWPVFREVVSSGDTYMFPPDISEEEARAAWLFIGREHHATFVARLGDVVIGTAIVKPNAPGLGDHVANGAWMVWASARGRGVGRRFAEHVIEHARRLGYRGMQFNAVVSTNEAGLGLWRSLGFEIVGTVPEAFRHRSKGLVAIHVMYRRL